MRFSHNLYPGSTKRTANVLGMPKYPSINQDGGILFDGDDWTYNTFNADAQQFANNWLAAMGAAPGDSIIHFNVQLMGGLLAYLTAQGYNVVDGTTVPFGPGNYAAYKVLMTPVFIDGPTPQAMIDYVEQGGNVYLQGGMSNGPFTKDDFTTHFGVSYDPLQASVGYSTTPGTGLFAGVTSLYHDNPNALSLVSLQSSIIFTDGPTTLMAAYNLA